jgi:hypothetical protein
MISVKLPGTHSVNIDAEGDWVLTLYTCDSAVEFARRLARALFDTVSWSRLLPGERLTACFPLHERRYYFTSEWADYSKRTEPPAEDPPPDTWRDRPPLL